MSAAKMVADSTQSELAEAMDGRKKKKKVKKTGKKVVLPEDEDSDLDLKKDLKPISDFVKKRPVMIEEMFRAVRGASLQRALPDLLKSIPLEELKQLCLEQLEVMSKKRIRRILAGEESANISSSGTEDDTTDEESAQPDDPSQQPGDGTATMDGHPADSTSVHQDAASGSQQDGGRQMDVVMVKQEPPDSAEEEEAADYQEEEEEEEEAPGNYTSGSEDGELVKRQGQTEEYDNVIIKQEPMSDEGERGEEMEEGGQEEDADEDEEMEDYEGDLMASVQGTSEEGVLPSIMMDQMELLELEMRARAIKAMLSSHADDATHEGDDEDDENAEDNDNVDDTNDNVDDDDNAEDTETGPDNENS